MEFGLDAAIEIPYLSTPESRPGGQGQLQTYATSFYAILAILYLFYPLAGCLADIRYGRYKIVIYSLRIMTGSGVIVCIGFIVLLLGAYDILPPNLDIPFAIGFGPPTVIAIILLLSSSIGFSANIIQFGMDQLHDSNRMFAM